MQAIDTQKSTFHFKTWPFVIVAFSVSFLFRIWNLEVTGLWMDEIHTAFGVDPSKSIAEMIEYCKQDQPPFFFLLLHAWFKIFPFNDFFGRLFVVLIGSAGPVAMYFLGLNFRSKTTGLICAFVTSMNYMLIDMSRQMRFYPLVFLLSALSFLFFYRVVNRRANTDFLFYILCTAALLNTHYFGIVVFVTQFIMLLVICFAYRITDIKFIGKCLLSGVITALSFAHWLPVVLSDIGITEFHIKPIHWYFPAEYWWVYFQDPVACVVFALLIAVALYKSYQHYSSTKQVDLGMTILIGWIFFSFSIPLIYSIIKIPMLEYKYSVIALPAFFVLIALGAENLNRKLLTGLAAVLTVSYLSISIFFRPIYLRKPFEQWREITDLIRKTDSNEQFVFSNYAWYFRYYFKQANIHHQPFEPRYADFAGLLNQANRVYVVTQTRYPDEGLTEEQLALLNKKFRQAGQTAFADATATFYVRKKISD